MSFSQHTKDTINGWGILLRFVTPVMLTILVVLINMLIADVKEVRIDTKVLAKETQVYFTNHLSHHAKMEKELCERLVVIETRLKR